MIEFTGWLAAMTALAAGSAFFSSSEAALFYLRRQDLQAFRSGNPAQRTVAGLLEHPDRLLFAVLFWNLLINITFFAISSIVSIQLQNQGRHAEAGAVAAGSLLAIIFFGEMFPKSLGVLYPRLLAAVVAFPVAVAVRIVDPVMPFFRLVNLLLLRLFWPKFQPEPYLDLRDLERAIQLSTTDEALLEQEQTLLNNIVSLSEIRVDELMRPRTHFLAFRPPVSLADLDGRMTPSGYLLVTEPESEDIAGAIPLQYLSDVADQHLERYAERVFYIPWCATASTALEAMRREDRKVAAIVNELGETIGILTAEDILATIFADAQTRGTRLSQTSPIHERQPGLWHVSGMMSLRRLGRHFDVELPATKSVTVTGMVQEVLQRLPVPGDQGAWGPFRWEVLEVPERGQMTVRLTRVEAEEDAT